VGRSYAKLIGALESPRRGVFLITALGKGLLALPEAEGHERALTLDREFSAQPAQTSAREGHHIGPRGSRRRRAGRGRRGPVGRRARAAAPPQEEVATLTVALRMASSLVESDCGGSVSGAGVHGPHVLHRGVATIAPRHPARRGALGARNGCTTATVELRRAGSGCGARAAVALRTLPQEKDTQG